MSTLAYTVVLPASQAQGPAGTLIDKLIDLQGNFFTSSSSKLGWGADFSAVGKILATPTAGNDPVTGQPYLQSGQAVTLRFDPIRKMEVALHLKYSDASNTATYLGYKINVDPGTGVISGSIINVAGTDFFANTTVVGSGTLVQAVVAIQQVSPTQVNVYADYRLASDPSTIVSTAGKLNVTHANAITQNSQAGLRGVDSTTGGTADQIKYYSYDGVITNSGGFAATNLPTFGSDLTTPAIPVVSANGLGHTSVSLSSAGSTSATGPITYQWMKGAIGDAGSAMTPVAGQTGLSATIPLTAGAFSAVRLKATDAFPGTPGVQYSNELPIRAFANPALSLLKMSDSLIGNSETWTDTTQGGSVAANTTLAKEIANVSSQILDRRVYSTNYGQAGAKTADWRTDAAGGAGNYFNSALAAYATTNTNAGYTAPLYALILLGVNDAINSVSAATYQANLINICNGLLGQSSPITPVLITPTWASDHTPAGNAVNAAGQKLLLVDYPATFAAVVAGAPGTKILTLAAIQSLLAANAASWFVDGTHPAAEGVHQMATAIGRGIANLISPGGPGGFRGILTGGGM
jgi:lysophospholipase L1-like esterase